MTLMITVCQPLQRESSSLYEVETRWSCALTCTYIVPELLVYVLAQPGQTTGGASICT